MRPCAPNLGGAVARAVNGACPPGVPAWRYGHRCCCCTPRAPRRTTPGTHCTWPHGPTAHILEKQAIAPRRAAPHDARHALHATRCNCLLFKNVYTNEFSGCLKLLRRDDSASTTVGGSRWSREHVSSRWSGRWLIVNIILCVGDTFVLRLEDAKY